MQFKTSKIASMVANLLTKRSSTLKIFSKFNFIVGFPILVFFMLLPFSKDSHVPVVHLFFSMHIYTDLRFFNGHACNPHLKPKYNLKGTLMIHLKNRSTGILADSGTELFPVTPTY